MGAHSTELRARTQGASDQATDSSVLQSTVFRIIGGKMYKRIWIFDDRGDPVRNFLGKIKRDQCIVDILPTVSSLEGNALYKHFPFFSFIRLR